MFSIRPSCVHIRIVVVSRIDPGLASMLCKNSSCAAAGATDVCTRSYAPKPMSSKTTKAARHDVEECQLLWVAGGGSSRLPSLQCPATVYHCGVRCNAACTVSDRLLLELRLAGSCPWSGTDAHAGTTCAGACSASWYSDPPTLPVTGSGHFCQCHYDVLSPAWGAGVSAVFAC